MPAAVTQPSRNTDEWIEGIRVECVPEHVDTRGSLLEMYRGDEQKTVPLPVMAYASFTHPGVVRGPHEHREQTDVFYFLGPSVFDLYLWDARPSSVSYEHSLVIRALGTRNPTRVVVPPGVVHGYVNMGACSGLVINLPDRLYGGEGRRHVVDEVRHESDPDCPYRIPRPAICDP